MKSFLVNHECINCRACVKVTDKHFKMVNSKAVVYHQPNSIEDEELCEKALSICPVNAIKSNTTELITAESKVRETLEKYPELKEELFKLSPKFKRLTNKVMWNSIAKFARFKDTAKVTGVSICEILHTINEKLGIDKQLISSFPECIKTTDREENLVVDSKDNYSDHRIIEINSSDNFEDFISEIEDFSESKLFVCDEIVEPIINLLKDRDIDFTTFKDINGVEYVAVKQNIKKVIESKKEEKIFDVRNFTEDPFDVIIKKAYSMEVGDSFILAQTFKPAPMISMLEEMGFDSKIVLEEVGNCQIRFTKLESKDVENDDYTGNKVSVSIQSATPVAYPVIMRLLKSKKLKKRINIKELKVWDETEKHLSWIVNGRADISFSALITSQKLQSSDVVIPAIFVWDNFFIITRDYEAEGFEDLKGKIISTPLFEEAPPAKITKYLMKEKGYNPDDFKFTYGEPFGRPNIIANDIIMGKTDTVILREPEAGHVVSSLEKQGKKFSVLPYNKIWKEIDPNFDTFPNAGIVFKGEFARNNPEVIKLFLEELKESIEYVKNNKREVAEQAFDIMRMPIDSVESFLNRVTLNYVEGDELVTIAKKFFDKLYKSGISENAPSEEFLKMFKKLS